VTALPQEEREGEHSDSSRLARGDRDRIDEPRLEGDEEPRPWRPPQTGGDEAGTRCRQGHADKSEKEKGKRKKCRSASTHQESQPRETGMPIAVCGQVDQAMFFAQGEWIACDGVEIGPVAMTGRMHERELRIRLASERR
jgi:hypothetical protein